MNPILDNTPITGVHDRHGVRTPCPALAAVINQMRGAVRLRARVIEESGKQVAEITEDLAASELAFRGAARRCAAGTCGCEHDPL